MQTWNVFRFREVMPPLLHTYLYQPRMCNTIGCQGLSVYCRGARFLFIFVFDHQQPNSTGQAAWKTRKEKCSSSNHRNPKTLKQSTMAFPNPTRGANNGAIVTSNYSRCHFCADIKKTCDYDPDRSMLFSNTHQLHQAPSKPRRLLI